MLLTLSKPQFAEFDWSEQTARNFINVSKSFKNTNFVDLDIAPSALYQLSAPSTPESAREEAMERAMKEPISHSDAKEIVNKHTNGTSGHSQRPEDEG